VAELDDVVAKAHAEANEVFARLGTALEGAMRQGGSVTVLDVARQAGLELDERTLAQLHIDPVIPILPWLPWYVWFPWRPIWCWWWNRRYSWYRSCPWWWNRCYWHPPC
jgi:hypothetical protein